MAGTYVKWAKFNNIKCEVIESSDGYKSLEFTGKNVFKYFQHEGGKHCVQRVPPTESRGRRQTSMISVSVLPLKPEYELKIPDKDIEIICQLGGGPGGQNVNRVHSAVRMKHKPTGIDVFINGRDQHRNKKLARSILCARVAEHYQSLLDKEHNAIRQIQVGGGGRSGKVRTYNFIDSRVTDHNLEIKTTQIDKVLNGHLEYFYKA